MSASARPGSREVARLLGVLQRLARRQDLIDPRDEAEDRAYARLHVVIGLLLVGYLVLGLLNAFNHEAALAVWSNVVLALAVTLAVGGNVVRAWQNRPLFVSFSRAKHELLHRAVQSADQQQRDLDDLLTFDLATLTFVRDDLKDRIERQQERTEVIFGLAGKAGAFPTLLAAGIAFWSGFKALNGWPAALLVVLTALLVANTMISTDLQLAVSDLRRLLSLLERALTIKQATSASAPPTTAPTSAALPYPTR